MVVNGDGAARIMYVIGAVLQAREDAKIILMWFSALPQASTVASPFRTVSKLNWRLSAHGLEVSFGVQLA